MRYTSLAFVFAVTVISMGFSAPSMADAAQSFCASKSADLCNLASGTINGKSYHCDWNGRACTKQ